MPSAPAFRFGIEDHELPDANRAEHRRNVVPHRSGCRKVVRIRLALCGRAIYGIHMAKAIKTTVYLDEADYEHLKDMARAEHRAPAELLREALSAYVEHHRSRRRPKSVGIGRSGKGHVAERAERLLEGMGRDHR